MILNLPREQFIQIGDIKLEIHRITKSHIDYKVSNLEGKNVIPMAVNGGFVLTNAPAGG